MYSFASAPSAWRIGVQLDPASDRERARVPIAGESDAIWYSSATERLYVAIGQPGVIDVVDSQRPRLYVFLPRRYAAVVYEEAASPRVT